jgi:DNA-binding winged helix-turn-helix (wHTH) protein
LPTASATAAALSPPAPAPLRIRGAVADLASGLVRAPDGTETELRRQSAAMLGALAARRGEIVGKDALHAAVWGDVAVTDDSLVQCIADIRRALGPARDALHTLPRRGYRLEAEGAPPPARVARAPPRSPPSPC